MLKYVPRTAWLLVQPRLARMAGILPSHHIAEHAAMLALPCCFLAVPQERFEIEMAELDAEEAKLVEAEEEELWLLTLQQQSRHIQVRGGVACACVVLGGLRDRPQATVQEGLLFSTLGHLWQGAQCSYWHNWCVVWRGVFGAACSAAPATMHTVYISAVGLQCAGEAVQLANQFWERVVLQSVMYLCTSRTGCCCLRGGPHANKTVIRSTHHMLPPCLTRCASCLQQHIEFDLPQSAYAYMDPILYKKLDWELTHGLDLLHQEAFQAADCEQVSVCGGCVCALCGARLWPADTRLSVLIFGC